VTSTKPVVVLLALLAVNTAGALEATPPVLATIGPSGEASAGPCVGGALSATGRYVVFTCASSDLVVGDTNARNDAFIFDRLTKVTERVSVDSAGQEHRFDSYGGYPSADGRFVAFNSYAPLHPDLTFPYVGMGVFNPFLRDRAAGTTDLVGRNAAGGYAVPSGSSNLRAVSFPAQQVLFSSQSNMLTPAPPPVPRPIQIYRRYWVSGDIELVTATPTGAFSAFGGSGGSLSSDGRFVAFLSGATDLGADNPNRTSQLMLRDMQSRTTRRLSFTATGGEFAGSPYYQALTGNFSSDARLLAIDANSDELAGNGAIGRSTRRPDSTN
jgi:Tol biopolymer transport system component